MSDCALNSQRFVFIVSEFYCSAGVLLFYQICFIHILRNNTALSSGTSLLLSGNVKHLHLTGVHALISFFFLTFICI